LSAWLSTTDAPSRYPRSGESYERWRCSLKRSVSANVPSFSPFQITASRSWGGAGRRRGARRPRCGVDKGSGAQRRSRAGRRSETRAHLKSHDVCKVGPVIVLEEVRPLLPDLRPDRCSGLAPAPPAPRAQHCFQTCVLNSLTLIGATMRPSASSPVNIPMDTLSPGQVRPLPPATPAAAGLERGVRWKILVWDSGCGSWTETLYLLSGYSRASPKVDREPEASEKLRESVAATRVPRVPCASGGSADAA